MNLNRLLLFCCICLLSHPYTTRAQQLTAGELIKMWQVSDTSQTRLADSSFKDLKRHYQKARATSLLEQLRRKIEAGGDERLKLRLWMYRTLAKGREADGAHSVFLFPKAELLQAINDAHKLHDEQLLSELYSMFTNVSPAVTEEVAFYYTQLIDIQKRIGVEHFPDIYRRYLFLSGMLHDVGEYRQALRIGLNGLQIQHRFKISSVDRVPQYDIVASCYKELKMPDSVLYYYTQAKAALQTSSDKMLDSSFKKIWQGIIAGGIGQAYFLKGDYNKAVPLLQQNIASSSFYKQYADAALAQNTLADIYFSRGQYHQALSGYQNAYTWAFHVADFRNLAHASKGLASTFRKQHNNDSAWYYYTLFSSYKDSLNNISDHHLYGRVSVQSEYDRLQTVFAGQKNEAGRQKNIRNLIIAGIAILTIFVLLLYNRRRLQAKLQQERLEKEKQSAEAEAARVRQEMAYAHRQMETFARNLSEKNRLIETLNARFDYTEKLELNEMLRNFTILTGNDWLRFKDYFETAYPGYWQRLQEKIPGLSTADQRLMAFLKLGLGHKEIAAATGISHQSIRVALHRLRKKTETAYPGVPPETLANDI